MESTMCAVSDYTFVFCFQALLDSQSAQQIAPNDELYAYIGYTSLFIDEILC